MTRAPLAPATWQKLRSAVSRSRLVDTALDLCSIYSPTGHAGEVSDRLAELLAADGFNVERPTGGHDTAPAVAVRVDSGKPGPTLGFDGHLDTVHLPFVTPQSDGNQITGSGAADMKAGVAAAVEALRVLRDTGLLSAGSVLFTAHDLHEAPWGDGSQLDGLIRAGYVGDATLIPEYQRDHLAISGRGQAVLRVRVSRPGAPIHEVYRPLNEPHVIEVGAELIQRLFALGRRAASRAFDRHAGRESLFIGQVHSGEIYNQFPSELKLEGTRRWLPGRDRHAVEAEFRQLLDELAADTGATIEAQFMLVRDAYYLDVAHPFVETFQNVMAATDGQPLPLGGKPFVDDGNTYWALAKIPAITHGPRGGGAHTLEEWVSIDDLCRVAMVYAATAVAYCTSQDID